MRGAPGLAWPGRAGVAPAPRSMADEIHQRRSFEWNKFFNEGRARVRPPPLGATREANQSVCAWRLRSGANPIRRSPRNAPNVTRVRVP